MLSAREIYSLTEFQRKTREHIARLKETGRPAVLTVNGKAEVVVQDAEAYQDLLDLVDQAEAVIGIQRGLESMARGEGRPLDEALDALRVRAGARLGG
ncbi:MAG TPA: type II toxin-antitoxin system Phd/YefM family antitoxin [Longimicrobiaceae bacterium]|nr:type II toxin-antitoxin system Phd/YefM family antitoxin [Longimicrobiaceae bacterium]